VAAQIAITLVLVVGADARRSLMKVLEVNPGFRVDQIVTMDVSLPWVEDPKAKASQAIFFSNLMDRLKQIQVCARLCDQCLPMDGGLPDGMFLLMTQNEIPGPWMVLVRCSSKENALAMQISASPAKVTSMLSEFL